MTVSEPLLKGEASTPEATSTGRADENVSQPGKYRSFRTRLVSTIVFLAFYALMLYMGHVALTIMLLIFQCIVVKELFQIARLKQEQETEDAQLPGFRFLQWYFFATSTFWNLISFTKHNLLLEVTSQARLARVGGWLLKRHTFISYSLYTAGLLAFTLSLKQGYYKYQFRQLAWTHMILLVVICPSCYFFQAVFQGIIWFLLPTLMVVGNDICAYLAGFFFGRTPLIKLSPKKTWEGFVGGAVGTLLLGHYLAAFLAQFKWMTCPREDFSMHWLDCEPAEIFSPRTYTLTSFLTEMAHITLLPETVAGWAVLGLQAIPGNVGLVVRAYSFVALPLQMHAIILAIFASLIAPFGGFFASGLKRAVGVKDFGHSIPGHGGLTDRFDCQIMIAVFHAVYYANYVAPEVSVGGIMTSVLLLPDAQKLQLMAQVGNLLAAEGLLPEAAVADSLSLMGIHR